MPADNPAAIDINASGGFVTEPTPDAAERATTWLVELAKDDEAVEVIGRRTRVVAEQKFEAESIADSFESVISAATPER
jgi:hypothetical protein